MLFTYEEILPLIEEHNLYRGSSVLNALQCLADGLELFQIVPVER